MPTINYCDYINGNDDTGDGTTGNPYKTITKASTGLTGGDEVRVAKSPAPTALTGTLAFTKGSTALTGTSTLFTSELVVGDFVKGGDDQWYEVVTITDNTNAVLFKNYPSANAGAVSSYKLGVTSTGEAAATSTQVQVVSASGSSTASRLKISGGWDLTGPTQDGQTYFRQMHGTFGNRYGYGLYTNNKQYLEIDHLHFLRYDVCCYLYIFIGSKVTGMNALSAGDEAIYVRATRESELIDLVANSSADDGIYLDSNSYSNTITSPICNSNDTGIYLSGSYSNTIISPTCNGNRDEGIYLYTNSDDNVITSPTCNDNDEGLWLNFSSNNIITSPTCNDNNKGIYLVHSYYNVINKFSGTGNTADVSILAQNFENVVAKMQHFNAAGDNRCYYDNGVTYRDTANARSTQCLKYDPSSATYYISQSFFFKADSGVEQTLSAYIKDDADFNGDIQAAIYFLGEKITGWSEWTPTTSYAQKSIVAAAEDITEDGVLELRIKVRGTAGNVFVDDLSSA